MCAKEEMKIQETNTKQNTILSFMHMEGAQVKSNILTSWYVHSGPLPVVSLRVSTMHYFFQPLRCLGGQTLNSFEKHHVFFVVCFPLHRCTNKFY